MQDEIFDIVDEDGLIISEATREEAHQNPNLLHPVVHAWIFNHEGQVLLQKRAKTKKLGAGLWDISVGGHLVKGDNPKDGLERELREELYIVSYEAYLIDTYIVRQESQSEYIYLYLIYIDNPDQDFYLQEEEVEEVRWYDLKEIINGIHYRQLLCTQWVWNQLPVVLQYLAKSALKDRHFVQHPSSQT